MVDRLWALFDAVARGGAADWPALVAQLEPELAALAKHQPIGRLRDREDTPREVTTRALARLHGREFATIRKLCALDPRPELRAWLRVLVRRSAIDYMRESPEFERGTAQRAPRWISLATLSSREVSPQPDTLAQKRREVLAFVNDAVTRASAEERAHGDDAIARLAAAWKIEPIHVRRLVARGTQYLAVLAGVLQGSSYNEVADELGLTRRAVELTVRYLEELLQARRFAGV